MRKRTRAARLFNIALNVSGYFESKKPPTGAGVIKIVVDKMVKMAIIIVATPLNRNGREPGTGALSHSIVNQTKLYFGLRVTRLITGLFKGVATSNSNRSDWAGDFFINQNETTPDATNTQGRNITRLQRSQMMRRDCTDSASGSQATNLSISQQIKQTQSQVDSLMESIIDKMEVLADLMRQLQTLQIEQENL